MTASVTTLQAAYARMTATHAPGSLVTLISGFNGPTAPGDPVIVLGSAPSFSPNGPSAGFNDLIVAGCDPSSGLYDVFVIDGLAYQAYTA